MKQPKQSSHKFSGKAWQRRIDKVVSGKIHIRQIYQWVREGRIDADQFEEVMQAIICPDAFNDAMDMSCIDHRG